MFWALFQNLYYSIVWYWLYILKVYWHYWRFHHRLIHSILNFQRLLILKQLIFGWSSVSFLSSCQLLNMLSHRYSFYYCAHRYLNYFQFLCRKEERRLSTGPTINPLKKMGMSQRPSYMATPSQLATPLMPRRQSPQSTHVYDTSGPQEVFPGTEFQIMKNGFMVTKRLETSPVMSILIYSDIYRFKRIKQKEVFHQICPVTVGLIY